MRRPLKNKQKNRIQIDDPNRPLQLNKLPQTPPPKFRQKVQQRQPPKLKRRPTPGPTASKPQINNRITAINLHEQRSRYFYPLLETYRFGESAAVSLGCF